MAEPFPPARGQRAPWSSLGAEVLHALQEHFGAPVVQSETCPEGFSPAVAAVVKFANGTSAFVKAVNKGANPDSRRRTATRQT